MSKYEVGRGKPPKTTRYRPGVSGNPKGRPRRKPSDIAQIVRDTLSAPIQYREGERFKVATYLELKIKKLIQEGLKAISPLQNFCSRLVSTPNDMAT
jgi:hypothetical protein